MSNLDEVDSLLEQGAKKASEVANTVLQRVRIKLGFENS